MAGPFQVASVQLHSDTPVCGVPLETYVLCRRPDTTTVSAGCRGFMCVIFETGGGRLERIGLGDLGRAPRMCEILIPCATCAFCRGHPTGGHDGC